MGADDGFLLLVYIVSTSCQPKSLSSISRARVRERAISSLRSRDAHKPKCCDALSWRTARCSMYAAHFRVCYGIWRI